MSVDPLEYEVGDFKVGIMSRYAESIFQNPAICQIAAIGTKSWGDCEPPTIRCRRQEAALGKARHSEGDRPGAVWISRSGDKGAKRRRCLAHRVTGELAQIRNNFGPKWLAASPA